jgi:broad specificity phosphatase PhoE
VIAGGLRRQQETARCLVEEFDREESLGARVEVDSRWNEFDLFRVYHQLGPILAAASPTFAADWVEMRRERAADPHATRGATGRCDRAIIEAWIEDRYPLPDGTETWPAFRQRVQAAWEAVGEMASSSTLAIVTSAAPIALTVGILLSIPDDRILRLMTVLYNASLTILRWRREAPLLISFNTTPHLSDPTIRTFR